MQRTIQAPDKEWLTAEEAAEWLTIGIDFFKRLVRIGEFPNPVQIGGRTQRYHWMDVVAYSHMQQAKNRPAVKRKKGEKSPSRSAS